MDVEIAGVGSFDVLIQNVSEQDALKAIEASVTPKVRGAFQKALDEARERAAKAERFRFVQEEKFIAVYDRKGHCQATIRKYAQGGRKSFYQAYLRPTGENVRRYDYDAICAAIAERLTLWEDNRTLYKGANVEDLL